jgi:predicted O-methyltransferase YrrM
VLNELAASAPYDMVFIDADKPGYPEYLDWAEEYVRKGGLIVGDNTLLFGHVWSESAPQGAGAPSRTAWNAMREFNRRLADPAKYHSVLIPTEEGMTVAIKLF